jgi:hypothetical protein
LHRRELRVALLHASVGAIAGARRPDPAPARRLA